MGGKRWQRLHRAVYGMAVLALVHFLWMREGKNNLADVWFYAAIVAALLLWRVVQRFRGR